MPPETMTVIEAKGHGGPDVLVPAKRPVPVPGPGEVLIEVKTAGVNRPDVLQRLGLTRAQRRVRPARAGSRRQRGGVRTRCYSLQERRCRLRAHQWRRLCRVLRCAGKRDTSLPDGLSPVEAAALPETVFTVWHNVFERGGLEPGEWLLVHGGASGIGTTAIQMGRLFGAQVLAAAGSAEKVRACEELGAIRAINYREEDFVEVVKEATQGHGADVILDMVGGDYIERNLRAAAIDGRIVQIAFLKTSKSRSIDAADDAAVDADRLDLARPERRGQGAHGPRHRGEGLAAHRRGQAPAGDRLDLPAHRQAAAHARIDDPDHIGKIVLVVE